MCCRMRNQQSSRRYPQHSAFKVPLSLRRLLSRLHGYYIGAGPDQALA